MRAPRVHAQRSRIAMLYARSFVALVCVSAIRWYPHAGTVCESPRAETPVHRSPHTAPAQKAATTPTPTASLAGARPRPQFPARAGPARTGTHRHRPGHPARYTARHTTRRAALTRRSRPLFPTPHHTLPPDSSTRPCRRVYTCSCTKASRTRRRRCRMPRPGPHPQSPSSSTESSDDKAPPCRCFSMFPFIKGMEIGISSLLRE